MRSLLFFRRPSGFSDSVANVSLLQNLLSGDKPSSRLSDEETIMLACDEMDVLWA